MLIEFRAENHRSLRAEQVLSLETGFGRDPTDIRPRMVSGNSVPLLPAIAIYGANASGKSNVLDALTYMRDAAVDSHRSWDPDGGVPRDKFAWGRKATDSSLFEVVILIDSTRYQYGFTASDEEFVEEWLYAFPKGKKQIWFERDKKKFSFGDNLRGEKKTIEDVTRSNSLFLSAAAQNAHPQLTPIYTWFRRIDAINVRRQSPTEYSKAMAMERWLTELFHEADVGTGHQFEENEVELRQQFVNLLRHADLGIRNVRVETLEFRTSTGRTRRRENFYLEHQSDFDDSWLPLAQESKGTQTLFNMALPLLLAIQNGTVLLIDELERSLHPSLASVIVQLFNTPSENVNNAQLIFTTHDTNLLGTTLQQKPILMRDQVWLTEKDKRGGTQLYPLTDFHPRKSENLERGYLQGRYGAIPFLGDFTIAEE